MKNFKVFFLFVCIFTSKKNVFISGHSRKYAVILICLWLYRPTNTLVGLQLWMRWQRGDVLKALSVCVMVWCNPSWVWLQGRQCCPTNNEPVWQKSDSLLTDNDLALCWVTKIFLASLARGLTPGTQKQHWINLDLANSRYCWDFFPPFWCDTQSNKRQHKSLSGITVKCFLFIQ